MKAGICGLAALLMCLSSQLQAHHRFIDQASAECAICHIDHLNTYHSREQNGAAQLNAMVHPIGLRYADYVSFGGYNATPRMFLVNGRLSCLTCHRADQNPELPAHGKLLVAADQLCVRCHNK